MFGREIWDKSPKCIFENFEIARVILTGCRLQATGFLKTMAKYFILIPANLI